MELVSGRDPPIRQLTTEEEAAKRSTDCVYFLASPLTCKKGSECEYRHSEIARLNPRDCWYWLNGNCLNAKCGFRHPPLEGLTVTTPRPAAPPTTPQAAAFSQASSTAHGLGLPSSKQTVPCYYFQKGACLKGDKCQFMHGPTLSGKSSSGKFPPMSKAPPPASLMDRAQLNKKDSGSLEGDSSVVLKQQPKPVSGKPEVGDQLLEIPGSAITNPKITNYAGRPREDHSPPKQELPQRSLLQDPSQIPVNNDHNKAWVYGDQENEEDDHPRHGSEDDDGFLPESPPGFDVLVDEDEDGKYFHNAVEYDIASGRGGRNLDAANDFEFNFSEYDSVSGFDAYQNDGKGEYIRYGSQSERIPDRLSRRDRMASQRDEGPLEVDGSDLRHYLLKQRRLNSLRSVLSPDFRGEAAYHARSNNRRDPDRLSSEISVSSRLRGRITLPRKRHSPEPYAVNFQQDRENNNYRGRIRSRLSPPPPPRSATSLHKRQHRNQAARSSENWAVGRVSGSDGVDFAGPKSLAELKGVKVGRNSEDDFLMGKPRILPSLVHKPESEANGSQSLTGEADAHGDLATKGIEDDQDGFENDDVYDDGEEDDDGGAYQDEDLADEDDFARKVEMFLS